MDAAISSINTVRPSARKHAAGPSSRRRVCASANPYAPLDFTIDQGPGVPPTIPPFPSSGLIPLPNGFGNIFPGVGPFPHSYSDGWNVTVEHSFAHNIEASIGYVGNVGRKLWSNIDPNAPVPGPGPFDPRRPYFAKFGWTQGLLIRNDEIPGYPDLTSNYNSLQAKVEKRFSNGLYILSNFVWAKSLDYGTSSAPGIGPENYFNVKGDYSNSSYVAPWGSVTAVNWELPFGRGKTFNLTGACQHHCRRLDHQRHYQLPGGYLLHSLPGQHCLLELHHPSATGSGGRSPRVQSQSQRVV